MQGIHHKDITYHNNSNIELPLTKKIIQHSPTALLSSSINLATANISHVPFNKEEYQLILYFKNGGKVEDLSYQQLILLSNIYKFTQEDLIALKSRHDFLEYLHNRNIVNFDDLPQIVKQEPVVCLKLFNEGDYSAISCIPKEQQTQNMCNLAFNLYSGNLIYFNDKFKTAAMCKTYLTSYHEIDISVIPKKFSDKQLHKHIIERVYHENKTIGIELLPRALLKKNPELIVAACIYDSSSITKFPPSFITEDIIVKLIAILVEDITVSQRNVEEILTEIKQLYYDTQPACSIIDTYFKKYNQQINKVISEKIITEINNQTTKKQPITAQQFILKGIENYHYKDLPKEIQADKNIIKYLLNKDIRSIYTINKKYLTKEICHQVFVNNPDKNSFEVGLYKYRRIITDKCDFIAELPIECRTPQMWFYLCTRENRKHIAEIPNSILTKDLLIKLVDEYIQWNNKFDLHFIEYLFSSEFFDASISDKILTHCLQVASRFSTVVFSMLKSNKIPDTFKNNFLQNIITGNLYFPKASADELYAKTNPLQRFIPAPTAIELLVSCYKFNNANKLVLPNIAQSLQEYLNNITINKLPLNNTTDTFTGAKVRGGRTIQVNISDTEAKFYKFRKPKETLASFTKEAVFLDFIATTEQGKSLKQQLKSDIPVLNKLVAIPITELPACAFHCQDGLDIYTNDAGIQVVDVIVFSCSKDYLEYAHKPDNQNPQNKFFKPEQGLINAVYDLGVFMSYGIYHTNTLPAYHEGDKNRNWTALHMLLRKISPNTVRSYFDLNERTDLTMVGKMENWDTTATERPDYGYTGLRDFGDFEFLGEITSTLTRIGCKDLTLFSSITQKILAANTVCECLLATILLYARLHKQSPDYHYKNTEYRKNTASFIEQIFTSFLAGITKDKILNLAEFMGVSY